MVKLKLVLLLLLLPAACASEPMTIHEVVDREQQALRRSPTAVPSESPEAEGSATTQPASPSLPNGTLTLKQARAIGLQANPDIDAARARLESARAVIAEAQSAFLPTIEVAHTSNRTFFTPNRLSRFPSALLSHSPLAELPANPTLSDLINSATGSLLFGRKTISASNQNSFSDHSFALSMNWSIFDGFVRDARVLSAKHAYRASLLGLEEAQRLLTQAIDAAYYQWMFAREQLRVAQADEQFSQEQLADANRRLAANRLTRTVVLNFEVRVRSAEARMVTAERLQETARIVLAELMAVPGARMPEDVALPPLAPASPDEMEAPSEEEWLGVAMQTRPDLQQTERIVDARRENIRMTEGQFSPDVTFRGSWGYERESNLKYGVDDQSFAIGVELRWALYTGGFRTARLKETRADWWEAVALLNRKRLEVASDIRQRVAELVEAQKQLRLQQANLEAAAENRRLVTTEYSAGKVSLSRLNDAQRDYVESDGELARARVQLRAGWSNLQTAAGLRTLERPGVTPQPSGGE